MKICRICKQELDDEKFSKSCRQCKKCKSEKGKDYRKKWNQENKEHVRKTIHDYYIRNKNETLKRTKKWREENKEKFKESWVKSKQKNLAKYEARRFLRDAIRYGIVTIPNICESCGKNEILQGHHKDYEKPFEVQWLCCSCHGFEHRKFK